MTKRDIIQFISDRWTIPSKNSLKTKFIIGRAVQDLYNKLIKYFDFKDTNDIEKNKILQLIYQYQTLYNIQLQRCNDKNNNFEILNLGYEMLEPFYTKNHTDIMKTIGGDITIEFSNPNINEMTLEDNYTLKQYLFRTMEDKRLEKAMEDGKIFHAYFHNYYDNVDKRVKLYENLSRENFLVKLKKEKDFNVLRNLFFNDTKSYLLTEQICLKMKDIANSEDEKQMALQSMLSNDTNIVLIENQNKLIQTKNLLQEYEKILFKSHRLDIKESEILFIKGSFYLKSKEFLQSFKYFEKYFNRFILKQKKDDNNIIFIYLLAYCAYTVGNKAMLKICNKYLKKLKKAEFSNKNSLPFPIYFYK